MARLFFLRGFTLLHLASITRFLSVAEYGSRQAHARTAAAPLLMRFSVPLHRHMDRK
jgi:hypothetical protein